MDRDRDRRDRDRDIDRDRDRDRNITRHNSYSSNGGSRQSHHMHNNMNGKGRSVNPMPRHSPPPEPTNNNYTHNPHDDLIHYIYESWDKVSRELERGGGGDIKYFQDTRQNPNITPFDLEGWVGRRRMQSLKRQPHNS